MTTLGEAQAALTRRLKAAGIDSARLDARLLVAEAAGIDPARVIVHPEVSLDGAATARLEVLADRRSRREPMAQILGRREFWGLPFRVTADTLDPRPDTETLVEAALTRIGDRDRPLDILDLGTGTGCILLALLSELPNATGVGVDASQAALAVAVGNARALGLDRRASFALGDWGSGLVGFFDVIVSNPPYIPAGDIPGLQPEVALHEPRAALDGGEDGLQCYRALADDVRRLLKPSGFVAFEVGHGQAGPVGAILEARGLQVIDARVDLAGVERCVMAAVATAR